MPAVVHKKNRQDRGGPTRLPGRVSVAAKASAAAILALGLLGTPATMRQAHAISDLAPGGSEATLLFSPTVALPQSVPAGGASQFTQEARLCALNWGAVAVDVELKIIEINFGGFPVAQQKAHLEPNQVETCLTTTLDFFSGFGPIAAAIRFLAPSQCSQAKQWPDQCRVLGSLEVRDHDSYDRRIHIEPVFVPATPGIPRFTLPQ